MKFCAIAALILRAPQNPQMIFATFLAVDRDKVAYSWIWIEVIKVINCDQYGVVLRIWYKFNIAIFCINNKFRGKWYLI